MELVGKSYRKEFSTYLEAYKKKNKIITGGSKQVLPGEIIKTFMMGKGINLVDAPNGGLASKFLLKKGEELEIDERAYNSLKEFEYRFYTMPDGVKSSPLGFLKFKEIKEVKKTDPKFECKVCGKEFDTKAQLRGHMIHHAKVKGKDGSDD